jgi:hypothetical protein
MGITQRARPSRTAFEHILLCAMIMLPRPNYILYPVWIILLTACLFVSRAPAQEVVINPDAGITKIDLPTLRAIFGMRQTEWPNGISVTPFVMDSDSQLHTRFAKNVLQVFPYQLQQAWDRLVFSGTGQAPLVVNSPSEMRRRVAQTPGGIGYLPSEYLGDSVLIVEVVE